MRRIWNQSIRVFVRTPFLTITAILGYLILHIYMIIQNKWLSANDLMSYLNRGQACGLFLFLLLSIISYEYLSLEHHYSLEESISANPSIWMKIQFQRIVLLFPFLLITSATVFLYQFFSLQPYGALTSQVTLHLLLSCLLNVCLPQIIAVIFGALLASSVWRPAAYTCLTIYAFLTTSIAKEWFVLFFSGSISAWILELFSVTAPDTDWMLDPIYGLPIESCRWIAALFWILLFFALFLFKNRHLLSRVSCISAATAGCATCIALCVFFGCSHDSIVRFDSREISINGAYKSELSTEQKLEPANFVILAYQMSLSAHNHLVAEVEMKLTQNPDSAHYYFTLYQGYQIISITDGEGNALDYSRSGHYLDVYYPLDASIGSIRIQYKGTGVWFFSNNQAVALPGCISWYPTAGYVPFWDSTTNSIVAHSSSEQMTDFYITFDTPLSLVSNLEEIDDHTFSGSASSATFIGGLLEKRESDGIVYYDSPLQLTTIDFDTMQSKVSNAESILGTSLDLNLQKTKILCIPSMITRSIGGVSLDLALMPDYILVNSNTMLSYSILERRIPTKKGASALKELVVYYLYYSESDSLPDPLYESETGAFSDTDLPDPSTILTLDEMDLEYVDSMVIFEQALRSQMRQYGISDVLHACYEYLQSNETTNQVDFLYRLGGQLS